MIALQLISIALLLVVIWGVFFQGGEVNILDITTLKTKSAQTIAAANSAKTRSDSAITAAGTAAGSADLDQIGSDLDSINATLATIAPDTTPVPAAPATF